MSTKLAELFSDIAAGRQVAHEDHPLQHWDRTCPACLWEEAAAISPVNSESRVLAAMRAMKDKAIGVCNIEAKAREYRSDNPLPGDDSMAQGHKAVTARKLAAIIDALDEREILKGVEK